MEEWKKYVRANRFVRSCPSTFLGIASVSPLSVALGGGGDPWGLLSPATPRLPGSPPPQRNVDLHPSSAWWTGIVLRDSTDPTILNLAYDSGDDIHPNAVGRGVMAGAVLPLTSFQVK